MSIFKCKMCGGTIEFNPGDTIGICDSCGTKQTLPRLDDDRRANLYDRANHFRRNNEFDKAMGIYEQILNEDPDDAEAYWSLVLCRYGIEYVEDPATHKRVPTVNRAQFTSVFDDDNYRSAIQHADSYQRAIYEEEANAINEIQKGILAISQKEEPFDVFICYKETDANGRRTQDSVLANDLYHQLTQEGFKVFFSRITLEDKLGTAYEPYIFAALNSAKAMVVLGTKPEYFNAVWVKNEWSRYLSLVRQSGGRKVLIPAYRDMDPYDLPEEFSHLQAQDMSKLGFMQDLIRGIKKIVKVDEPKQTVKETVVVNNGTAAGTTPLLKRAFMFLEDGEWAKADEFCEQVLNIDPENAQAYLGKLMVELRVKRQEDLANLGQPFHDNSNFRKAIRMGDEKIVQQLSYDGAVVAMNWGQSEFDFLDAAELFGYIPGFNDSETLAKKCLEKAKAAKGIEHAIVRALKREDICLMPEQRLAEAKARKEHLEQIKQVFAKTTNEIRSLENRYDRIIADVKQLSEQDSKLGVFAFKEKKHIKKELADLNNERGTLDLNIKQLQDQLGGYMDESDLCKDINETNEKIVELDAQIERDHASGVYAYSYEEALKILRNNPRIKESIKKHAAAGMYKSIFWGEYVQNDPASLPEPIEWLILKVEKDRALLISKYALDYKPYNEERAAVSWETCSLRKWLNVDFFNKAFNLNEQEQILSSTVTVDRTIYDRDKGNEGHIDKGNDTTDKIFLLSRSETKEYFKTIDDMKCVETQYCHKNGTKKSGSNLGCYWWLRTCHMYTPEQIASFRKSSPNDPTPDGYASPCFVIRNQYPYISVNMEAFVRPAMWISTK